MDDWQLLDQYRHDRSNTAFARLVQQHLGLVYHVCRRRLQDAHLAEDASQAVFVLLARRGPRGPCGSTLAGWLYRTALHACSNARRARLRREHHERGAAQFRKEPAQLNQPISEMELALDEAISSLNASDRDLILMRFYEDRDLGHMSRALGISANTAAKRLSRAVARLRKRVASNGTVVGSAVAIQSLTSVLHQPAPPALVEKTIQAATTHVASPVVESITKGVIHSMLQLKAKLVAATVGLVVLGVGGGLLSVSVLMAQSSGAGAQSAAKAPGTQPGQALDPKGVLIQFAAAIRRNDAEAMRSMVDAQGQDQQQILNFVCEYATATGAFKSAIKDKFGAETLEKMSQGMNMSPVDQFATVVDSIAEKLEVTINGDEAILKAPDVSSDTFIMVKHEGRWKLSADGMTQNWTPQDWENRMVQIQFAAEAMRNFTQNIENGQYATPADLMKDVQALMNQGR